MNEIKKYPWAQYEQIDVPATGLKATTSSRWRNSSDLPIEIHKILVDSNSVTTSQIRLGIRGKRQLIDTYVRLESLHNHVIMANQTTDSAWPLWRFGAPVHVPPGQYFQVTLGDKVGSAARDCNVQLICSTKHNPSRPMILTDRVEIPQSGEVDAVLNTDKSEELCAHALLLYLEEVGSDANLRGVTVRVRGAAGPDWMDRAIPGSVLFPDSNSVASVLALDVPLILEPGDVFEADVRDTSGGAVTVYLGAVGLAHRYQGAK